LSMRRRLGANSAASPAETVILRHRVSPSASPMTGCSGVSSTLRLLDSITGASEYWIARVRACEEYRPHPEELAKQASRRMDTTHGLAAILRDAACAAPQDEVGDIFHNLLRGRRRLVVLRVCALRQIQFSKSHGGSVVDRHCERSEAIHQAVKKGWIASLRSQ